MICQSPFPLQEGKEPDPSKRPYVVQYSMKPKSAKKYLNVVQSYSNIILGENTFSRVETSQNLFSLLSVRHPIERLLSAYRDRIAGLKSSYKQYTTMARVLHLKRKDAVIEVKYKTKRKVQGKGFVSREIVHKRDVTVPTWPEFVNYILHTSDRYDVMT